MKTIEKYLNESKDANTAYKERYKSVLSNLDKLKKLMKKHSVKQAKSPMDWGYAGDIGYVDDELTELLNHL